MKPLHVVKLKSERTLEGQGQHIQMRVFAGADVDHLAYCGKLTFTIGQWQIFGAALLLGADKMRETRTRAGADMVDLEVLTEGDEEVVRRG